MALFITLLMGCTVVDRIVQLPQPSPIRQESPALSIQSSETGQMENQVWQEINRIRQQQGLTELRYNDKLAQVARNYSRRMAEENFFAHVSPKGDTLSDRARSAKIFYFVIGENLFTSTNIPAPASAAVNGWMNSPGHRENILYPDFRETGIGVWKKDNTYYFTQLLMRSL